VRLERMRDLAERFGLAMQLTNILKDVADDASRGTVFVPRSVAARHRLAPEALLDPRQRGAARAALLDLAVVAVSGLDAALAFTLLIPRRETRLRLFCAWPLFLAVRTLRRVLEDERVLEPGARARISRAEVRGTLGRTTAAIWSNRLIRSLYARERGALGLSAAG